MAGSRTSLDRVAVALDAVKLSDAQAVAEIDAALAEVDAAEATIDAEIRRESAALAEGDVEAGVVFYEWRRRQEQRRDALAARRATLEAEAERRRDALRRSNGETSAVERLIERRARAALEAARKKAARRDGDV